MENKLTQICSMCQEAKPYPGSFIDNYTRMEMRNHCTQCKTKKQREQRYKREGKVDKSNCWKNSMSKFYKF